MKRAGQLTGRFRTSFRGTQQTVNQGKNGNHPDPDRRTSCSAHDEHEGCNPKDDGGYEQSVCRELGRDSRWYPTPR
jgi:hypothetical protein